MFEIVNAPTHDMIGVAFAAQAVKKGTFMVASGTFTQADIDALPAGQKNKPGYAYVGSKKLVPAYGQTVAIQGPSYPVDKKIFKIENADSDEDIIPAGAQVVYYKSGEFRTSEFTDLISAGLTYGSYLKTSASGTLTEEAALATPTNSTVARVISLDNNHADSADHRLHFELINVGV